LRYFPSRSTEDLPLARRFGIGFIVPKQVAPVILIADTGVDRPEQELVAVSLVYVNTRKFARLPA
jgi:hypothetical protein